MKFHGFQRTSRRRLWINRIARWPKWKHESAARMLKEISAFACVCAPAFRASAGDGAVTGVAKCETKAAGEDGKSVSSSSTVCTDYSSCWISFRQHFPICWLIGVSLVQWNVSSCCVQVHICSAEKNHRKKCACRERHVDTKAKFKRKEWCMQELQKKILSKQTPNPLKILIQGKCSKRGRGTGEDRDVHYPSGTALRPLPKENTCSRSSRRRFLCSCLHASTQTISEHNPKFSARKKASRLPLIRSFSSTTISGTEGSRP